jgi:uncharacterized protein involved in exopolysaccharide biosynthesis
MQENGESAAGARQTAPGAMNGNDGSGVAYQDRMDPTGRASGRSFGGWTPVEERSLRDLTRRVARRWRLLLVVAGVAFVAVAAYTFLVTPRYRSTARVRIETQETSLGMLSAIADQTSPPGTSAALSSGGGLLGLTGRDELETEIAVLSSNRIADATIDALALSVRLTEPAASRADLLSANVIDPNIDIDGKLELTRTGNGHYRADWQKLDIGGLPTELIPNVPVRVGGVAITLRPTLLTAGPEKIAITFLPRYKVYKLLEHRLMIQQQEGGSKLVEVSFDDPDRVLASQVVAKLITEYVTYATRTSHGKDTLTVSQLRFEVDSTQRRLAQAEVALRRFEEQSRFLAPEAQLTAQVRRISAISARVDQASAERSALSRMLTIIEDRARSSSDATAYRQLATFPTLITNRAIQNLLQTLLDLDNKAAEMRVRRSDNNPDYKAVTDRIAQLEQQLYLTGTQYLESLNQQLTTTVGTVQALNDSLQVMPGAAMEYARLLRDRTINEAVYVTLVKQLKAAELRDDLRQDKAQIVDVPRVANRKNPVFPKKPVMLVLGAILAMALAVSVGLFMEVWWEPRPAH